MEPEDFRQFRRSKIRFFSRMKLRNIFRGEWESIYTGEGIEFDKTKPFEPEDDLRELDLQTLLETGEEEIIQRVVERQMRIFVWVDFSGSMLRFDEMFFSRKPEIRDIGIGLLLFSAWNAYSPVGLCAFNRKMKQFFPARQGERYCWEILDWIIEREYGEPRTSADHQNALSFLIERTSPQSLVFWISDFEDEAFEQNFTTLLRPAVKKFDLVPVVIRDPLEKEMPFIGSSRITVRGSEGDEGGEIYLTRRKLTRLQKASSRHLSHLEKNFRKIGVEPVILDSPSVEKCHAALSGFFESRRRLRS